MLWEAAISCHRHFHLRQQQHGHLCSILALRIRQMLLDGIGAWAPVLPITRAVVDFSSPNIAKEMHVGHLRSTIIGDCLARMLEFSKVEVLRRNHVGDWGTQAFYKASKQKFDEDTAFKEKAQQAVVRLQGGEEKYHKAWQQICDISRKEFDQVYKRLKVEIEEKIASNAAGKYKNTHQIAFLLRPYRSLIMYRLNEEKVQWIVYVTDVGQSLHFEMFFSIVEDACNDLLPNTLCEYLYNLSENFTKFYSTCKMAEYFQQTVSVSGRIPLGSFNTMFNFSGSWQADAAATKSLVMDGVFIALYKVQLKKLPLGLREEVKHAVPRVALARFVETFGTHIVTDVTVGGRDVIYVKQGHSSPLSSTEIEKYVKDIGDQRFSDLDGQGGFSSRTHKDKIADPFQFNNHGIHPQPPNASYLTGKEDVTVIFRRRGGDDLVQSHKEWETTVYSAPDVINMSFVPIISLLEGIPGKDHLKRAIDLYLECCGLRRRNK